MLLIFCRKKLLRMSFSQLSSLGVDHNYANQITIAIFSRYISIHMDILSIYTIHIYVAYSIVPMPIWS